MAAPKYKYSFIRFYFIHVNIYFYKKRKQFTELHLILKQTKLKEMHTTLITNIWLKIYTKRIESLPQILNSVKSNSFKYQRFTPRGCKHIRIRKFEFMAKLNSFDILLLNNLHRTQQRKNNILRITLYKIRNYLQRQF